VTSHASSLRVSLGRRLLPWLPVVITALMGIAALWLESLDSAASSAFDPMSITLLLGYAVTAGVIGRREPANRVWWLLGLLAILMCGAFLTERYTIAASAGLVDLPVPALGAAMEWLWPVSLGCLVLLTFLVPTGRTISRAWQWAFRVEVGAVVLFGLVFATGTTGASFADTGVMVANPLYVSFMGPVYELFQSAFVVYLVMLAIGVAALAVRFHRSHGVERQQLKWILLGFVLMVPTIAISNVANGLLSDILFTVALAMLPASLAIAIGRYRLYDIDRIISRTFAYALVTGLLAGLFALLVVALQGILAPLTEGNALAVAASTLVVASLFQPVRRRLQRAVDHRFDRAHYDAEAIVMGFASRARDGLALSDLTAEMAAVATRAVAPASTGVWLRVGAHR
jgi:hypothetical protein